jgi:FdhD protein
MGTARKHQVLALRVDASGARRVPDELIVEEPLEVRLDGHLVATTMRTPGHDFELAVGLCFTDGLLDGAAVRTCRYCATGSAVDTEFNVVTVDTGGRAPVPTARLTPTSSSCGLCGSADLTALAERLDRVADHAPWPPEVLGAVAAAAEPHQELFAATGAVHAAASFDRSGAVEVVREDIGRHNAVDKVVGRLVLDDALPATDRGLFVSGRASFEMVQKAWAAGFEAVVAVSAPSALAVDTAATAGMTLAGFARGDRINLYTGVAAPTLVPTPAPVGVAAGGAGGAGGALPTGRRGGPTADEPAPGLPG